MKKSTSNSILRSKSRVPIVERFPSYKGRTTLHLSDDDRERLEAIKEARGAMSWAEVIRGLIREEELRLGALKGKR